MLVSRILQGSFLTHAGRLLSAVAVLLLSATWSKADVITVDVAFTADTFQVGSGPDPAPVDPVVGEFRVSFDTNVAVVNNTAGITLTSLNIALGSPLSFSYNPAAEGSFTPGTLRVGGLSNSADVVTFSPSTNDFWLYITDFTNTPTFSQLGYSQTSVSGNNLFFTLNQTGTVNVSAIPEPSAMHLCGALLAAAVGFRRRKR